MCNETLLTSVLSELEEYYGGQILNGKILENTWRNGLSKLSDQQLQIAVARCFQKHPRKYNYFPCVDDILELARGSMPSENSQAYATADLSKPALPPSYEGTISPEEAEASRKEILISKLFLLRKSSLPEEEAEGFFFRMRECYLHELEQMLLVANSPTISNSKSAHSAAVNMFESLVTQATNTALEDMRKYLRSGVENNCQKAIDWAIDNGYQLVKKGGKIVDIVEVEF